MNLFCRLTKIKVTLLKGSVLTNIIMKHLSQTIIITQGAYCATLIFQTRMRVIWEKQVGIDSFV